MLHLRKDRLIYLLLFVFFWTLVLFGGERPCAAEPEIFPLDQVRPGMEGYGLSTFKGADVERFNIKVLGVLKGRGPKADVVLIEMHTDLLDKTGVIAGMSGSPVYLEGKLLGAVAYGWYFCQIPFAGVTPAAEMWQVREIDRKDEAADAAGARRAQYAALMRERARELSGSFCAPQKEWCEGEALKQTILTMMAPLDKGARGRMEFPLAEMPSAVRAVVPETVRSAMRPLPVPLAVSSLDGRTSDALGAILRAGGLFPVQAPAVVAGEEDATLQPAPGLPVGALLIGGDMNVAAMGTLTAVAGDRILAFGHSLFGSGTTNLPLALGKVHAVVPSYLTSFRITSADKVIGRLVQDRDTAILGRVGEDAPMFPCTVRVRGAVDDEYRYQVAGHWQLAPILAGYVVASSCVRWEGAGDMFTLKARSSIRIKGVEEPITLSNVYPSFSPIIPGYQLVWSPIQVLVVNPFKEVEVEGLDFELEVEKGFKAALIESVRAVQAEVEPGGTVELDVTLRRYRGGQEVKQVTVTVPKDAKPGTTAKILICSAPRSLGIDLGLDPGLFAPRDFDELLRALRVQESNTSLVVRASFQEKGLRYEGEAMPNLPASALEMLTSSRETGKMTKLVREIKTSVETPWVIQGAHQVSITVSDPLKTRKTVY